MNTLLVAAKYGMSWLLDFAQVELNSLTAEEKLKVRADLKSFGNDSLNIAGFEKLGPLHYKKRYRRDAGVPEYDKPENALESWSTVTQRHAELRRAVSAWKRGAQWSFPSRLKIYVSPTSCEWSGPELDMFRMTATFAAITAGRFVRPCKNAACGSLFMPEGKMCYCSPRCRNKANWEAFQKTHPNRKRDYRAEYLARVKRESGS
jgi:hypothetical protein